MRVYNAHPKPSPLLYQHINICAIIFDLRIEGEKVDLKMDELTNQRGGRE